MRNNDIKLAHYTSARVALSIIEKKEIWLNNVQNMNDYKEITNGQELLKLAFDSTETGEKFRNITEEIFPGSFNKIIQAYNFSFESMGNTFAFCLTEHSKKEDNVGRLSMWRAYASVDGVAMVFNLHPFLDEATNTALMTIPMFYCDLSEVTLKIEEFIKRLEENKEQLKSIDEYKFVREVSLKLIISVLSLKHKGFQEELEWRVLHNDMFRSINGDIVETRTEVINGIPKIIKCADLQKIKYQSGVLDFNKILSKIIIGASRNPEELKEIFIEKLNDCGIADAKTKVVVTDIPMRV